MRIQPRWVNNTFYHYVAPREYREAASQKLPILTLLKDNGKSHTQ